MPLQNRVDPFGDLIAVEARGLLLGNRGGRFHRDDRTLGRRRFASRQWICCVLDFKGRHRDVWGRGYTELFFLDEVTAFAAGHRPCFECRRKEALAFAALFPARDARAAAMDRILHTERLDGREKRMHARAIDALPDGIFIHDNGYAFALRGDALLPWTPSGYGKPRKRPRGATMRVLTPPSIAAVLAAGYAPLWHPSARDAEG
ncbi:MAG: hypothetical protein AB7K04_08465 [Pseudorhodoplanes sp.]